MGSHESAKAGKTEWLTPPEIIEGLGSFDLDPCSPVNRPWATAKKHYTEKDDGLSKDWKGFVWCNPPYGLEAADWLKKLKEHGNGIALIFARTETAMFFDHVWEDASALFFFSGRLFFYHVSGKRADSNGGAPSVLIAYGDEAAERLKNFNRSGIYIDLKDLRLLGHIERKHKIK